MKASSALTKGIFGYQSVISMFRNLFLKKRQDRVQEIRLLDRFRKVSGNAKRPAFFGISPHADRGQHDDAWNRFL